jgi:hypothetical protein
VDENHNLTVEDMLPWLKKVDRLIVLASGFNDRMGEATLKKQLEHMGEMYKVVTGELAPHLVKGEPSEGRRRHGALTGWCNQG